MSERKYSPGEALFGVLVMVLFLVWVNWPHDTKKDPAAELRMVELEQETRAVEMCKAFIRTLNSPLAVDFKWSYQVTKSPSSYHIVMPYTVMNGMVEGSRLCDISSDGTQFVDNWRNPVDRRGNRSAVITKSSPRKLAQRQAQDEVWPQLPERLTNPEAEAASWRTKEYCEKNGFAWRDDGCHSK